MVASSILFSPTAPLAAETIQLEIGGQTYHIELARTSSERRRGLMHRRQLERNAGMLLVYPTPGDHRIWMKNVLIPLRVYWIDEQLRVIEMQRLEPCLQNPCATYAAAKPSLYVLELSDHEHDLQPGDRLDRIIRQ